MNKKISLACLFLALSTAGLNGQAADVNPFTGAEESVANLERHLKIARLKAQIANEEANARRVQQEFGSDKRSNARTPMPAGFTSLNYPTDKMPDLAAMLGMGAPGKTKSRPAATPAPTAIASFAAPPVSAPVSIGPRLVGVIHDEQGRVAIIEQGGKLVHVKEGDSAHGQKVTTIGAGWAEVGGKRLVQENSALALVTNVDRQPVARVASSGGAGAAPVASGPAASPVIQAVPFMPPSFQ